MRAHHSILVFLFVAVAPEDFLFKAGLSSSLDQLSMSSGRNFQVRSSKNLRHIIIYNRYATTYADLEYFSRINGIDSDIAASIVVNPSPIAKIHCQRKVVVVVGCDVSRQLLQDRHKSSSSAAMTITIPIIS